MSDSRFNNSLVLASNSPRRKELLELAGFSFEVEPSNFDEDSVELDGPIEFAKSLASLKAQEVAVRFEDKVVLGADTIVAIPEDNGQFKILGKPKDRDDAESTLCSLSNLSHLVITAYALLCEETSVEVCRGIVTRVRFRELHEQEIKHYLDSEEPYDKAGAYGIQGFASCFVQSIEGSYSNVVGLPLSEVVEDLLDLGIPRFN